MSSETEGEDENENGQSSSVKRIPKKKHYPFGTPSHAHPAFSEFVHLKNTDKEFVKQLSASSTKIEPEIIEVQPKRYRKPPPPPKAALADEEDDEIPDTEGSAPCTRPGCVAVVRAIIELQAKNYNEKLEIEDEYHRLLDELVQAENQVASAESKLEKLNEIGNQLEVKLGQLMQNVETLEKKKENLQNERSDINNKIMVSETESHKITRKLERAQKALADAMWRKKKQDQLENAEAGLSLAASVISEQPIKQTHPKLVAAASELHNTGYHKLAKVNVVDYNERQKGVKTLTPFLREKLIYEAETLDKYSQAFFERAVRQNLKSRHGQDELELDKLDDRVVGRFKDCGINGASFFFDPLNSGVKDGDRTRIHSRASVSQSRSKSQSQSQMLDRSLEGRYSRSEPVILLPHLQLSERSMLRQPSLGSVFSGGRTASEMATLLATRAANRNRSRSRSPSRTNMDPFELATGSSHTNHLLRNSTGSWSKGSVGPMTNMLASSTSSTSSSSMSHHAPAKLDPVFFQESARVSWGRETPLGRIRLGKPMLSSSSSTSSYLMSTSSQQSSHSPKKSVPQKESELKLYQQLKDVNKSKLLTTKHPGMDTFHDSVTLSATALR